MKQNVLQNVVAFIFKYIWLICSFLIVMELITVTYTSSVLIKQSALGVMQSVSGEVSGRVDGIMRLLNGMAADERFADTSQPLYDRVIQAMPYQESYSLYMIALTDEKVHVVSADEIEPPTEFFSLEYRDYMQRLYASGETQITDAFLSGDGKETLNYTIAVPVMKNEQVVGSVFGSISFDDIENILIKASMNEGRKFYLLGIENTIMAGAEQDIKGNSFLDLSKNSFFFGSKANAINQDLIEGNPGSFWEWDKNGLSYVTYQKVEPTNWSILYRVDFASVFVKLVPVLIGKILFYILLCAIIYVFGRRYFKQQLAQVNHLLDRMAVIQKELYHSEQPDYDNILELTQQGLNDQLTGLSTRAVLFKKASQFMDKPKAFGAVIFIDLDDLKRINDNFGHEGGDCALINFAQVLKRYEASYESIVARYGGDEFVFVINAVDEKEINEVTQKLCSELNTNVITSDFNFSIHSSIGVSFYPKHGTKLEELIGKSDLALYTAKQNGKNQVAIFSNDHSIL